MQVKDIKYYFKIGLSKSKEGQYELAIENYKKAIALGPDNPENITVYAHIALAYGILFSQNQNTLFFEESKKNYQKILDFLPNEPLIYYYLGNLFGINGQIEEALKYFKQSLKLGYSSFELYSQLAALTSETDCKNAIPYYIKALELEPSSPLIHHNIGYNYMALKNAEKSESYFKKAIELKPDYWDAYVSLATLYFYDKQFDKAWGYYERRFLKNETMRVELPDIQKPLWDGSSLKDKTICVYTEQGLGDAINFVRYLPILELMGAKVLFKMHQRFSPLEKLFKENNINVEILDNSIPDNEIECDTHVSLLSLPYHLKTVIENIPYKEKYLKANSEKVSYYKQKYFSNNDFKLGIVWQCKNQLTLDKYRSIPDISYFYPFAKLPNVKVYSLQKGDGVEQLENLPEGIEIINIGDTFNDFSDTAAAIENLDLLISVDTSVPHLAGAMGKPTWMLLSYMHSWRWTYDLEDSPWYDSVKLFRQEQQNVWNYPVEKALKSFERLISSNQVTN